jgi:hypothetical protein
MSDAHNLPPFSVKYVILGMLSEGRGRPPRDDANGAIEYFWPAEAPASAASFERCLIQLQHEAGITTTIQGFPPGREGVFRSRELARHIDSWYGGADGLHYGMFPACNWRDMQRDSARVSFLKGVLLRLRNPLRDPATWYIAADPIGWGCTLYHVLVDLDCDGAAMSYNPVEGGSLMITFPRTAWTTSLFEQDLPW